MRKTSIVLVMALALLTPGVAGAQPGHVSDVTMLTGPSPLTDADFEPGGCAWDPYWSEIGPTTGVDPLRWEEDYESTLAVDPTDPRRMTAVWLQNHGRLVGSATSLDGGSSWDSEIVPEVTTCSGGIHQRTFDTRVAIGPSSEGPGRAYVISTSQNQSCCEPRTFLTHLGVSTKLLDGSGWNDPVVIGGTESVDFPVIAADPFRPDIAYAMWTKKGVDTTFFSATHDGGMTWSEPALVRVVTPGHFALNELLVLRDGTIANLFGELPLKTAQHPSAPLNLHLSYSTNQGATWSNPELVSDTAGGSWSLIEEQGTLLATWTRPSDSTTGLEAMHGYAGEWTTVVARRGDSGWTEIAKFGDGAFWTSDLAIMPDGTVGLTRYASRSGPDGQRLATAEILHSHDGGGTWESTDLLDPFDISGLLWPGPGDHSALEATPCGFAATFTGGPGAAAHGITDIFAATLHLSPASQGSCNTARPPR